MKLSSLLERLLELDWNPGFLVAKLRHLSVRELATSAL